jgi:hypothetical protein
MPIFQFLLFRHIIISTLEVFSCFHLSPSLTLLHHHPEFNNNHVKARETRKSIKFSFSSPSIAFLCFFLLVLLFIHHLVGLLDCITFFLDVCTFFLYCSLVLLFSFGLSHSHHSFRFINLQPFSPHSTKSKERRRK